jgi:hypothetical protein
MPLKAASRALKWAPYATLWNTVHTSYSIFYSLVETYYASI